MVSPSPVPPRWRPPAVGELERVRQQVGEDLRGAVGIGPQHQPAVRMVEREAQALALHLVLEERLRLVEQAPDRNRRQVDLEPAGLDLGQVEDVVDDGEQVLRRLVRDLQELLLFGGIADRAVHDQAQEAEDGRQGGAQLVRGVGQELRLQPRGLEGDGPLLVELPDELRQGDRTPEQVAELGEELEVLGRQVEGNRRGREQHPRGASRRRQRQEVELGDAVPARQPLRQLLADHGGDHGALRQAFAEGGPARMVALLDGMETVALEGLDPRSAARHQLQAAAGRPVEEERAQGQQIAAEVEEAVEDALLLDLAGHGLGDRREEGEPRLPSFGGAPGDVEVGDVGGHHLDQCLVGHRVHQRLHLGAQPVDASRLVLDPDHLLPGPPIPLEHRRDRGVDLRPMVLVDALQPARARSLGTDVGGQSEQGAGRMVGVAHPTFPVHRQHQHRQGVEEDLHADAEPPQPVRERDLRLEEGDVLEHRADGRRGEAQSHEHIAPHEGAVIELARPRQIHVGDRVEEERGPQPHLARLPLLAAAEHRHRCGEQEDSGQAGLDRGDAEQQATVLEGPEDRPDRSREGDRRRGTEDAVGPAAVSRPLKGQQEEAGGEGLGQHPRGVDRGVAEVRRGDEDLEDDQEQEVDRDRQEHHLHVTIEHVPEQAPADLEEPRRERREQGVEGRQQQVLVAAALPVQDDLQDGHRQRGSGRDQYRLQPRLRSCALGGHENPAGGHDGTP